MRLIRLTAVAFVLCCGVAYAECNSACRAKCSETWRRQFKSIEECYRASAAKLSEEAPRARTTDKKNVETPRSTQEKKAITFPQSQY